MPEDDKPSGGSSAPKPAVKAKLPSAQGIKRPDFTPHGLSGSSKGRGPKPSALTAAQAKKRQRIMIAVVVVAALGIAGGATWFLTRPGPELKVAGAFGKEPTVSIPGDLKAPKKLTVSDVIVGKGPKLAVGDTAYVHLSYYKYPSAEASASPAAADTSKKPGQDDKKNKYKLGSTFDQERGGEPTTLEVGKKELQGIEKTLDKAITGHTVGSRVQVSIPPADGFGKQGNPDLGVTGTDSLIFFMDLLAAFPKKPQLPPGGTEQKLTDKNLPKVEATKPGEAPKVTVPKVDAPKELVVKPLVQGTGPALAKGQKAIVNYQGTIWKTGKTFDSSWQRGNLANFPIGTGGTVPGFDKGLLGQKVGSRMMLVLPPKEGYGKEGQPQAGIKGDDTLVFIVEILGVLPA